MNKFIALTAASVLSTAEARMSFGLCPEVENVTTLDKEAYAGKWYQIEQDASFPFTMGGSCIFSDYKLDTNGDYDFHFGQYNWFKYSGGGGKMFCPANSKETCTATMDGVVGDPVPFPVLSTDYNNYQIGYYCMDMIEGVMKADFIMIYGREKYMTAEKIKEVRAIIREKVPEYGYDWVVRSLTGQGPNCEYNQVKTEWEKWAGKE